MGRIVTPAVSQPADRPPGGTAGRVHPATTDARHRSGSSPAATKRRRGELRPVREDRLHREDAGEHEHGQAVPGDPVAGGDVLRRRGRGEAPGRPCPVGALDQQAERRGGRRRRPRGRRRRRTWRGTGTDRSGRVCRLRRRARRGRAPGRRSGRPGRAVAASRVKPSWRTARHSPGIPPKWVYTRHRRRAGALGERTQRSPARAPRASRRPPRRARLGRWDQRCAALANIA